MTRYMPTDWAIPVLDDLNRPFFTEGSLVIQRCAQCEQVQHPPEDVCHRCHGMEFSHVEAAGTGTVHSWAVMHYPVHPVLADRVPYNVALVALDDLPVKVLGNVVDVDADELEVGLPVQVTFEELEDPVTGDVLRMPQWTRVSGGR